MINKRHYPSNPHLSAPRIKRQAILVQLGEKDLKEKLYQKLLILKQNMPGSTLNGYSTHIKNLIYKDIEQHPWLYNSVWVSEKSIKLIGFKKIPRKSDLHFSHYELKTQAGNTFVLRYDFNSLYYHIHLNNSEPIIGSTRLFRDLADQLRNLGCEV